MDDGSIPMTMDQTFQYSPVIEKADDLVIVKGGALTCEDELANQRERLSPFRYGVVIVKGTIAAAGAPIVVAANQSLQVFTVGVGDPGTTTGGGASALTTAETNAIKEGGLVKQKGRFVTFGIGVNTLEPWHAVDPAADLDASRTFPSWLRDRDVNYGETLTRAVADITTMTLFNGTDAACSFDQGPLSLWNSLSGAGKVAIGLGGMAGQFWFQAAPQVSGGHSSGDEFNMTVTTQRAVTIANDAAVPTVAGVVAIPFRIILIGRPICGPGAVSAEAKLRVLEKRLAQLEGKG